MDFKSENITVVLVDDEVLETEAYCFLIKSLGIKNIVCIHDSRRVLEELTLYPNPIVFLDLNMPNKSGEEVLKDLRFEMPHVPVIICTANSEIEIAVRCLKIGAHDYLVKPITLESFSSALRSAVEIANLRNELLYLKGVAVNTQFKNPHFFENIITKDKNMFSIFNYIESIANSREPVLIVGETGTGKELVAKAVHQASLLPGDFVAVDVSGLDDNLFSDTLFGHSRGAYTGAENQRKGLIEKASNGTIFLDEISDLSENSQLKLLRLLQEGTYYPIGSDTLKRSNVRIISAINKNIQSLIPEKGLRKDLFYRLSTHIIKIPPLRERKPDVEILTNYFIEKASLDMKKNTPKLTEDFLTKLQAYDFPGNIRELRTFVYDAVARSYGKYIDATVLCERIELTDKKINSDFKKLNELFGYFPTLKQVVEFTIEEAIQISEGNQSMAAKLLGISKQALSKRLRNNQ